MDKIFQLLSVFRKSISKGENNPLFCFLDHIVDSNVHQSLSSSPPVVWSSFFSNCSNVPTHFPQLHPSCFLSFHDSFSLLLMKFTFEEELSILLTPIVTFSPKKQQTGVQGFWMNTEAQIISFQDDLPNQDSNLASTILYADSLNTEHHEL